MNTFIILVSTLLVISSSAFEDIVNPEVSQSTTESSLTDGESGQSNAGPNQCSVKCSEQIESLKKNITELQAAFVTLQSKLEHLSQHMSFHEKALKHIAVWGHGHNGHKHELKGDNQEITGHNESSSNEEQNEGSNRDIRGHSGHHNHVHHQHHHQHHIHRPHHSHNHGHACPHPCQSGNGGGHQKGNEIENKKKDKDSSEESSEEQSGESKPSTTTILSNELKDNENIGLNDSSVLPSRISPKRVEFLKPSVEEQLYFQSKQTEFKEWFTNMLDEIHNNHQRVDRSDNGLKVGRRLEQSAIDQMENALNSEDLIFATCSVKPNRHIALLNQQDVEGTINIWQLKHNRGPLHMHLKLKGFKVSNHEDSHHKHNGHQNVRRVRESILMPVEVEPDETTQPLGASHSHGFHVHEFGNMSRDCQSVGSHYNPLNLAHGGPFDVIRHVGDLGNIRCDQKGEIDSELSYSQLSLSGIHSIINRSLVIHSNADDYGRNPNNPSSAQTGSSGVRIACCVIEEVKHLPKQVDSKSPIISSKRRRDTSEPIFVNRNRYEEPNLSDILKNIAKYENDRKYKTSQFD